MSWGGLRSLSPLSSIALLSNRQRLFGTVRSLLPQVTNLKAGHPPGAPFFMLTANIFSQFASDPSQVARMVNTMSALLSATCILFLFWSITHLTRKLIIGKDEVIDTAKLIAIEASGLVGALIYTFSDTFWFSAVEGEVYAYSSAFTAVVFWLILKWEDNADQPHSDRWLVLIAYMTGLSIGVHLLNLLCIPAIVLVYYYKKNPAASLKGRLLRLPSPSSLSLLCFMALCLESLQSADGLSCSLSTPFHVRSIRV